MALRLFTRGSTALSPAASFAGIGAGAGKPNKDGTKAKPKGDEGDDDEEAKRQQEEAAAAPPASAAKDGDDDNDDDDDDDDDEDGDDDGDEKEMRAQGKKVCSARRRERARFFHVMSHPAAAKHPDFAMHMLLNTDMGRDKIVALLEKAPVAAAAKGNLASRMQGLANQHIGPSGGAQPTRQQEIDASWDRAIAKYGAAKS